MGCGAHAAVALDEADGTNGGAQEARLHRQALACPRACVLARNDSPNYPGRLYPRCAGGGSSIDIDSGGYYDVARRHYEENK